MKNYILPFIFALLINFGALWLGGLFTNAGVQSDWYSEVVKAPWTPPGWVFGLAWTTIGLTFSVWGAWMYRNIKSHETDLILYYPFSVILNIIWNPIFFYFKNFWLSSIVIISLSVIIGNIIHVTRTQYGWKPALLVFPYFLWLCIATSLNLFILIMN